MPCYCGASDDIFIIIIGESTAYRLEMERTGYGEARKVLLYDPLLLARVHAS